MEENLLHKAKSVHTTKKIHRDYTQEEIDLAVAWANDEVRISQIEKVLNFGKSRASVYVFLAQALKAHIERTK